MKGNVILCHFKKVSLCVCMQKKNAHSPAKHHCKKVMAIVMVSLIKCTHIAVLIVFSLVSCKMSSKNNLNINSIFSLKISIPLKPNECVLNKLHTIKH